MLLRSWHLMRFKSMTKKSNTYFTDNQLAAFLDGAAAAEECRQILESLGEDENLREILRVSQLVDIDLNIGQDGDVEILPTTAMVAASGTNCTGCPDGEMYILARHGIAFDSKRIEEEGERNGWHSAEGTALYNIGRHLESFGLVVERRFKCGMDDILNALAQHKDIIAVVDSGELISVDAFRDDALEDEAMRRCAEEYVEDLFIGEIPDHCVVVKACDMEAQTITLFDPNSGGKDVVCPISHFVDAWQDSKRYLVVACDAPNTEM